MEFGKNVVPAAFAGLGVGSLLYLVAAGINAVAGIWGMAAEIIFFLVGFSIPIGIALTQK